MKKIILPALTATILSGVALQVSAQIKTDGCSLITTEQINKIIGCNVQQGKGVVKGKRCSHNAADNKSSVTIEYYNWSSPKTASDMLKMNNEEEKKNIASGKKGAGIYTSVKDFPDGGASAMVLTSKGDVYTNGNVVRLQFVIGATLFTFDTQGMDMNKVLPKLKEVYTTIKSNAK